MIILWPIFLIPLTSAINLEEVLQISDNYFSVPRSVFDTKTFEESIKDRLFSERKKRSTADVLYKKETRIFQGTSDVTYTSFNSPTDLNGFELNGKIYAVSIQYAMPDGGKSEEPLLVLYKIERETNRLLGSAALAADGDVEVHNIRNNVLIAVTHKNATTAYQGCSIYRIVNETLSRAQVLNTDYPLDVKFASNLQQVYLAISTLENVKIFEWKGLHFDLLQELDLKSCSSLSFFNIDNILFLATVNNNEYNACSIWEHSLDSSSFECRQYLENEPAKHVNYFRLRGVSPGEEEHFLIIGYENGDSVFYKRESQIFEPFQRIPNTKSTQWFPFEDSDSFVLFQVADKAVPFAYNGWKFVQVDVTKMHDSLRIGCSKLRALQKSSGPWLIAVNSRIELAAMMRLSFGLQPSIQDATNEMNKWCEIQLNENNVFEESIHNLMEMPTSGDEITLNNNLTFRNLRVENLKAEQFGGFTNELVNKINELANTAEELRRVLDDTETLSLASFNTITVKGPVKIESLALRCEYMPCEIPKLETELLNGESAEEFVDSIVSLSDGIQQQGHLNFEILRTQNATSIYFNNHDGASLLTVADSANLGERLSVNGSVIFHGDVSSQGEIQGVLLDRGHVLLYDEDQTLDGQLKLSTATIKNLTIRDLLNDVHLKDLWEDMNPNKPRTWDVLNIANLTVNGRIAGHPAWKIFNSENVKTDNVVVSDGTISSVKISDLVRIDEGDYILKSGGVLEQPVTVENLQITNSINQIPLVAMLRSETTDTNEQTLPMILRNVIGDEVIIKGEAKIHDILLNNGSSLYDFVTEKNARSQSEQEDDELVTCGGDFDELPEKFVEICVGSVCTTKELENGVFSVDELTVKSLEITGKINHFDWAEFIEDAVFEGETVTLVGKNSVEGILNITDLVIDGLINNRTVDEYLNGSNNLVFDDVLTVENLYLNGVPLLADGDWNESFVFNNVNFEGGVNLDSINDVDIKPFLKNLAYINEPTTLGAVNFLDRVNVVNFTNYNNFNDAAFYKTIVVKNSTKPLTIEGHWLFQNEVVIDGELIVHGETNGMDLQVLCEMSRTDPKIIVGGSVKALYEPRITERVNNILMSELLDNLWLKTEPSVLHENVKLFNAKIEGNVTLVGNLNGIKLENVAKGYLSKSIPRRMVAPIKIGNLTLSGMTRAPNITGPVNKVHVGKFAENVLQHGIDQHFTGRPHFHELIISNLDENCTINSLNLRTDVMRYSTEAKVTGMKTVGEIVSRKFTIPAGKTLQGVNFDAWNREAVFKDSDVIYGNFNFKSVLVRDSLTVTDTVGGFMFDRHHLLTVHGNQTVTGRKIFTGDLLMQSLTLNGLINETDLNYLVANSAFSDRDVLFESPVKLENLEAGSLELAGELAGVNVTRFCAAAKNRPVIDNRQQHFANLLNVANQVYYILANGAYYLDHYEVVQKFERNVSAIAGLPNSSGTTIAVFRKFAYDNNVTLMTWDGTSHTFKPKRGLVHSALMGNTSLISSGPSHLLVETWQQGSILFYNDLQFALNISKATCATPIERPGGDICVFVGQRNQLDSLVCMSRNQLVVEVVQNFETSHCIQAASLETAGTMWLAVISEKPHRAATEHHVTVFSKRDEEDTFIPKQDLPVRHPVSLSATTHRTFSYLVVASQHEPGAVRSSLLAIFRYAPVSKSWTRYQEIAAEAPRFVSFEHLSTGQLALYVLTDNPARAFLVYLYRGAEGFVEETAGLAVHPGKFLSTFSGGNGQFVGIAGGAGGSSQLLQAHFLGRRFD